MPKRHRERLCSANGTLGYVGFTFSRTRTA
jgi:hypothetical protein